MSDPTLFSNLPLVAAALLITAGPATAQVISEPEARVALLERAERLEAVAPEEALERFAGAADPFYPEVPEQEETGRAEVTGGPTDREILEALAERIRPTGIMTAGDERVLLFGERRVRAGQILQLNHQGQPRQVRVGAIGPRSFTLQFGQEELSKPVQ